MASAVLFFKTEAFSVKSSARPLIVLRDCAHSDNNRNPANRDNANISLTTLSTGDRPTAFVYAYDNDDSWTHTNASNNRAILHTAVATRAIQHRSK